MILTKKVCFSDAKVFYFRGRLSSYRSIYPRGDAFCQYAAVYAQRGLQKRLNPGWTRACYPDRCAFLCDNIPYGRGAKCFWAGQNHTVWKSLAKEGCTVRHDTKIKSLVNERRPFCLPKLHKTLSQCTMHCEIGLFLPLFPLSAPFLDLRQPYHIKISS